MEFFSFFQAKLPIDTTQIENAILNAERQTSAEIRVVVERKAKKIKAENVALARAQALFDELQMAETSERNGVLIYLAFKPHYVAIVGDEGIHQKVGDEFWQSIYQIMKTHCQAKHYTQALCEAIEQAGLELARYFPITDNDIDELPNEVVIK